MRDDKCAQQLKAVMPKCSEQEVKSLRVYLAPLIRTFVSFVPPSTMILHAHIMHASPACNEHYDKFLQTFPLVVWFLNP